MTASRRHSERAQLGQRLHSLWPLLALALAVAGPASAGTELGDLSGDVEIGRGTPAVWQRAASGASLAPGDVIRTGRDGRVEVQLSAGTVRLYENSLLRIPAGQPGGDGVELERGSSIFDILRRKLGSRFEVQTPEVVVSVKGTRFTVDLSREIPSVAVFRGTVGVRSPGADLTLETLIRAGFTATGGGDRPFELELAPERDPWQGWEAADRLPDLTTRRLEQTRRERMTRDARAAALETTSAEVIERAARRNPEIAEKLEKIRAKNRREHADRGERHEDDDDANSLAPPAAPAPGERDLTRGEERRRWKHGPGEGEDDLRPRIRRVLREREEAQIEPENLAEENLPEIEPGQIQQILADIAPTLPGGGSAIDSDELLDLYQDFVENLYEQHAQELAQGGVEAYRALLRNVLVNRGLAPGDAASLANQIVNALH